jgi:glucokinase
MFDAVDQAINEAGASRDQIMGIGIGAPGPLNQKTGVIFAPPNLPGWHNVPLGEIFHQHFQMPIFIENDANAAALGEYLFGAGRGSRDMVYMTISTGIGGGIIMDGRLIEGIVGTAGELGHMTIDWHGDRCNCGNIGCLEAISSGTAIARRANELAAAGRADELLHFAQDHQHEIEIEGSLHINARVVAHAAEEGIEVAQEIIARAAEGLGVGLVNIIHIFNPERIILGGSVTQIGERLLGPAMKIVSERALQAPREAASILPAELGADTGLVGAGALIYYNK